MVLWNSVPWIFLMLMDTPPHSAPNFELFYISLFFFLHFLFTKRPSGGKKQWRSKWEQVSSCCVVHQNEAYYQGYGKQFWQLPCREKLSSGTFSNDYVWQSLLVGHVVNHLSLHLS